MDAHIRDLVLAEWRSAGDVAARALVLRELVHEIYTEAKFGTALEAGELDSLGVVEGSADDHYHRASAVKRGKESTLDPVVNKS